ncbi:MAG: hypothetical protein A4E58_00385 [Syntrophorhabdus sp. PtaB.Bin006]|nr:MAG: hypothetical protein A4E58_00385 [Syntrophorhabdus sp. PtaB.Bin006]
MICEKCGGEVETVACNGCGKEVAKLGPYCYLCGAGLSSEIEETDTGDFSDRVLCSDGTCIGVVNEQGVCKVCGKPYTPEA